MRLTRSVVAWLRMVKFSHSVFALPFALSGAALAAASHRITAQQVGWIVVAMVGARNAALGFNRLVDERFDRDNPRTAERELPRGRISRKAVWAATAALSALFVYASFRLGPLCGWLAPGALALVFAYSFTKRFTFASHAVLGLCLAMAPVGGWVAVAGSFSVAAWLLGAAVLAWVAGFDVVYACQDVAFDRRVGLHSIPARFGVVRALVVARVAHAAAFALLVAVGLRVGLGAPYWIGLAAIGALLVWQHSVLRADDLSRLGAAFFNANGTIGLVYFAAVLLAILV